MLDSERAFEELLGGATRRPEPAAEVRERVLAAVEAEWHASRRRRRWPPLAAAAAVAVAILAGVLGQGSFRQFEVQLAQTQALSLDGTEYQKGGATLEVRPGSTMIAGSATRVVGTGGTELRLRAGTELTWNAPDRVTVSAGALYVDTHGQSGFQVTTPAGVVQDIGTRFMVTVADDVVEVAMREGATRIDTAHGQLHGPHRCNRRGRGADRRARARPSVPSRPASARWDWIHEAHPAYRERSVPALLGQIAEDLGLGLDYASPARPGRRSRTRDIEGDLGALEPRDALHVVLATNGLTLADQTQNRIVVEFQSAGQSE